MPRRRKGACGRDESVFPGCSLLGAAGMMKTDSCHLIVNRVGVITIIKHTALHYKN